MLRLLRTSYYRAIIKTTTRTTTMDSQTKTQIQVAVLHQAIEPPMLDGSRKPMKPGGYKDSSADIAYALSSQPQAGIGIITPVPDPDPGEDTHWSFPDTESGILEALAKGATHLWANTILFSSHPLQVCPSLDKHQETLRVISQPPRMVESVDDKYACNLKLGERGVCVAESFLFSEEEGKENVATQRILKPLRGRGSFGVKLCRTPQEMIDHVRWLRNEGHYEGAIMSEEFLGGEEITITVLPSSSSSSSSSSTNTTVASKGQGQGQGHGEGEGYTALPPITRFNHEQHIAPYNGTVAVSKNSRLVTAEELQHDDMYKQAMQQCETIAGIIGATAPVRIDLRRAETGLRFKAFDVNVKPNMTGPGRPAREDQDSLSALAAKGVGWDYHMLIQEIVGTARLLGEVRAAGRPSEEEKK